MQRDLEYSLLKVLSLKEKCNSNFCVAPKNRRFNGHFLTELHVSFNLQVYNEIADVFL